MKEFIVKFSMTATVQADDERDAREKAALRLCQFTPNDMESEIVQPRHKPYAITVSIKRKNVYGKDNIYVCEPIHAGIISSLTGKRTVDEKDIKALEALGVTVRDIDAEIAALIKG